MFEEFRLSMLRELMDAGLDEEAMRRVMGAVDKVGSEYDVTRKETALVPLGMAGPRIAMEYLACKSLEGLSKLTLYTYQTTLAVFMRWLRKPMDQVEANDVRLFLYQYQQRNQVSNRTLDHMRQHIKAFFDWASAEGRVAHNPCASIHAIKYTAKPRTALTQLELEYIRRACGDRREHAIVEMLYSTGCRVSELCGMTRSDINWQDRTVQVLGKGGKYRTCFLNAKAYVALTDYLASRDDDDPHLIVSERKPHQGLTRYSVEKIVRDISDRAFRATGKRVTPHIFRHTTATTALQNGMPVQNVSRMLGHSQIETTMIYAEVKTDDVQRDHMRFVV